MRINPSEKVVYKDEIAAKLQAKTDKITRIVALVVAFLSTYLLIFKILFF
ncbi:hypothetical protein [Mucilaginibacter polytrichastri]|uniref:Uncharacterized protein n=1 Tax=Mucilaginibacter polytrichastri TaxID=1302689 RepID=A0A1Q5ZVZ3_9SPHI|nr:hypothetical protein [Mucilaginibacter polytrichastri]OKS85920.1 hypothetical protein RG47T_1367 [Mucilaginibacter polytrichastri]SFS60541.1 hypothetical protein SAMN04487890_102214 [Mucilaginibacter polytrichastri]